MTTGHGVPESWGRGRLGNKKMKKERETGKDGTEREARGGTKEEEGKK